MNIEWKKQVFGIEVDLVGNKHHDERLFDEVLLPHRSRVHGFHGHISGAMRSGELSFLDNL